MPRITAPLLSFDARGQIAKTQVYSSWRGIPYVRRYAVPNNPNTSAQQDVRGIFSMLNSAWLFAPTDVRAPWEAYAVGRPLIGRNAIIQKNSKALSGPPVEADLSAFEFSPGARGGLPPSNLVATGGALQISCAYDTPAPPSGWTLTESVAAAIPNVDPTLAFGGVWASNVEAAGASPSVITGLVAATEYVVGVWLVWTKPDLTLAYSVALSAVEATT